MSAWAPTFPTKLRTGGDRYNVLGGEMTLLGTLRSFDRQVRLKARPQGGTGSRRDRQAI
jgi:hypothetical protein